jgi:hypothetical protein
MFCRIKAMGPEPTNMVHIPARWFDTSNHPVTRVSEWCECLAWANARSEMEDLPPCFFLADRVARDSGGSMETGRRPNGPQANDYRMKYAASWYTLSFTRFIMVVMSVKGWNFLSTCVPYLNQCHPMQLRFSSKLRAWLV